ncbi:diablo IAP-binding mitochondrial protein-like [Syngnathoides biaculeatus]|uniref:diablo IAP-binding mitochondrial protein-like n=1 Tax=Syngnathoides biaculeatus TaxID=300417 RepID=UPI002ADE40B0|nr:diablo IAP-binding mitochondrial protein-like [Syngnathoides biaculeatus]
MQAVRQCSACGIRATGGLLASQRDVSSRRGAACSRLMSHPAGVLFSARKMPNSKLQEGQASSHTSAASSNLSHLCSAPSAQQAEHLTHDALIRRATSLVTDGTGTLLSQSTFALVDALDAYTKALHTRIALQRRFLTSLGKLSPAEEDSLQQAIYGQKTEVSGHLDECKRFETTWIKAVNLCQMAAEAAYAAGSEQASATLTASVSLARSRADRARNAAAAADKKLAETKVDEIQRMAEYAASLEDADELEIHEAYLRED